MKTLAHLLLVVYSTCLFSQDEGRMIFSKYSIPEVPDTSKLATVFDVSDTIYYRVIPPKPLDKCVELNDEGCHFLAVFAMHDGRSIGEVNSINYIIGERRVTSHNFALNHSLKGWCTNSWLFENEMRTMPIGSYTLTLNCIPDMVSASIIINKTKNSKFQSAKETSLGKIHFSKLPIKTGAIPSGSEPINVKNKVFCRVYLPQELSKYSDPFCGPLKGWAVKVFIDGKLFTDFKPIDGIIDPINRVAFYEQGAEQSLATFEFVLNYKSSAAKKPNNTDLSSALNKLSRGLHTITVTVHSEEDLATGEFRLYVR